MTGNHIIQVTRKRPLDYSLYGQVFVVQNLIQGINRYGHYDQGVHQSTNWRLADDEVSTLERDMLMSWGAQDYVTGMSRDVKSRVDQLESIMSQNCILNYHEPSDITLGRAMRKKYGSDIRQYLTIHQTPQYTKGQVSRFENQCDKNTGPAFDGYIAVSDFVKRQMIYAGFPARKVTRVYNGINTELYSVPRSDKKAALRHLLDLEDGANVFSYMGRLDTHKGIDVLKSIIAAHEDWMHDSYFLIASSSESGSVHLMSYISKNFPELAESNRVRFYLDLSKFSFETPKDIVTQVNDYFNEYLDRGNFGRFPLFNGIINFPLPHVSDLGIFPTIREALGLVPLEYIACGVPIIGSDVGGTSEILRGHMHSRPVQINDTVLLDTKKRSISIPNSNKEEEFTRIARAYIDEVKNLKVVDKDKAFSGRKFIMDSGFTVDSMTKEILEVFNS